MEGKADVVAAAVDLVDDVDAARCPVQQNRATMQRRRVKRGVTVVLSGPPGDVAVVDYLDLAGMCMAHPHEGTAFAGLAPAAELDGVVRDRRPEIRTPRALAVITVGARISQDVDARVADLDGQSVRMGMRGDAEVPVRAAIASAPDLICSAGAQQRHPRVGEPRRPLNGPALDMALGTRQGTDNRAAHVGRRPWPPVQSAEERVGRGPAMTASGWAPARQAAGPAFVGITLAGRAQALIDERRRAVRHRTQPLPRCRAQRMTARLGLDGRDQPEFGDEALVIRGELPADTGRERIADELSFEQERGLAPPAARFPGTTGRRSWPRAVRRPRRSHGCWPRSRGCGNAARYC